MHIASVLSAISSVFCLSSLRLQYGTCLMLIFSFIHSTCGIFGYTFRSLAFLFVSSPSMHANLTRETLARHKMWLKLIQMINQIKEQTMFEVTKNIAEISKCPPAISIIRKHCCWEIWTCFSAIVIDRFGFYFYFALNILQNCLMRSCIDDSSPFLKRYTGRHRVKRLQRLGTSRLREIEYTNPMKIKQQERIKSWF